MVGYAKSKNHPSKANKRTSARSDFGIAPKQTKLDSDRPKEGNQQPNLLMPLPAELRTTIYYELLTFEEGKHTCHPAILVTCKEVQQGATGMLYFASVEHSLR